MRYEAGEVDAVRHRQFFGQLSQGPGVRVVLRQTAHDLEPHPRQQRERANERVYTLPGIKLTGVNDPAAFCGTPRELRRDTGHRVWCNKNPVRRDAERLHQELAAAL